MWKRFIKEYLTFSRKDRLGIIVLVSLITLSLCTPLIFPLLRKQAPADQESILKKVDQLNSISKDSFLPVSEKQFFSREKSKNPDHYVLFYFDPNEATLDDWIRLGISEKVASTILKYREKGGRFHSPEDLNKIYTLSKRDVERLIPYARIRQKENVIDRPYHSSETPKPEFTESKYYGKNPVRFDINLADTSQWKTLPGIGSKLSARIVNFREKLGGFVSPEQVGETRFLPDSTFQKIKPYLFFEYDGIRKINVNSATVDELKAHPYLSFNTANAIVQYREQHGSFHEINDLKRIQIIDEKLFDRIRPYLEIR